MTRASSSTVRWASGMCAFRSWISRAPGTSPCSAAAIRSCSTEKYITTSSFVRSLSSSATPSPPPPIPRWCSPPTITGARAARPASTAFGPSPCTTAGTGASSSPATATASSRCIIPGFRAIWSSPPSSRRFCRMRTSRAVQTTPSFSTIWSTALWTARRIPSLKGSNALRRAAACAWSATARRPCAATTPCPIGRRSSARRGRSRQTNFAACFSSR